MLIGPVETSAKIVLEVLPIKLLMLADAAALTSMMHEAAVHCRVPPKYKAFETVLTPPAALATINPDAERVRSVAADRSTVPP